MLAQILETVCGRGGAGWSGMCGGVRAQEIGRVLRALPEEQMADVVEQLQLGVPEISSAIILPLTTGRT